MIKRIALAAAVLGAAAVGMGYVSFPAEFREYVAAAADAGRRLWANVEANPVPVVLAAGTFLLTVVYHKARGKSLRESVEVAATRVTVIPVPAAAAEGDADVVKRAKARATRAQLIADQIGLQNRIRKLPDEVTKAEKEACYAEQAVADAERALQSKWEAHEEAVAKLGGLRGELVVGEAELAAIDTELKKLAEIA
jgi:hypothetical protein